MKLYAGLDLSFTQTGLTIVNNNLEIVDSFNIKTQKKDFDNDGDLATYIRIGEIASNILVILADYQPIEMIAIETCAFGAKGRVVDLGGLHHVLAHRLLMNGFNIVPIAPTSLKKFFTGNGRAKKNDMLNSCSSEVQEMGLSEDQIDAYALALYAESVSPKAIH